MHDVEVDSDSEHKNISKIEPTKAEEEALARGLQVLVFLSYLCEYDHSNMNRFFCLSSQYSFSSFVDDKK